MIGAIIGISSVLIAVITLVKLLTFYKKHSSTRSGSNSNVINTSMSMTSNSSTTTRIAPDSSISLHSLPPESEISPSSTYHHLNQTPSFLPSSKLVSNPNHKLRSNQRQSNSLICNQMWESWFFPYISFLSLSLTFISLSLFQLSQHVSHLFSHHQSFTHFFLETEFSHFLFFRFFHSSSPSLSLFSLIILLCLSLSSRSQDVGSHMIKSDSFHGNGLNHLDYVLIHGNGDEVGSHQMIPSPSSSIRNETSVMDQMLNFKLIRENLSSFIDPNIIDSLSEEEIELHLMKVMANSQSVEEGENVSFTQILEVDSSLNFLRSPDVIPAPSVGKEETVNTFYCNLHPPCVESSSLDGGMCELNERDTHQQNQMYNHQEPVVSGSDGGMRRKNRRSLKSVTFDSSLDSNTARTEDSGINSSLTPSSYSSTSSSLHFHHHVDRFHKDQNDGTENSLYGHQEPQNQEQSLSSGIPCNDDDSHKNLDWLQEEQNHNLNWLQEEQNHNLDWLQEEQNQYPHESHCGRRNNMVDSIQRQATLCHSLRQHNLNPSSLPSQLQTRHHNGHPCCHEKRSRDGVGSYGVHHHHHNPNWPSATSSSNCSSSSSPTSLLIGTTSSCHGITSSCHGISAKSSCHGSSATSSCHGSSATVVNNASSSFLHHPTADSCCDDGHSSNIVSNHNSTKGTNVPSSSSSLLYELDPSTVTVTTMMDHSIHGNCSASSFQNATIYDQQQSNHSSHQPGQHRFQQTSAHRTGIQTNSVSFLTPLVRYLYSMKLISS